MTLRQLAGITCKEVTTLCAVREATVRCWEAGRKPLPRAIVLPVEALNKSILDFPAPATWKKTCRSAASLRDDRPAQPGSHSFPMAHTLSS